MAELINLIDIEVFKMNLLYAEPFSHFCIKIFAEEVYKSSPSFQDAQN